MTIKAKIVEKIEFEKQELKNLLAFVASDIQHLRRFDEDFRKFNQLKYHIKDIESDLSALKEIVERFKDENVDKILKGKIEIKEKELKDFQERKALFEMTCQNDSYEKRKKQLAENCKILKGQLRFWGFTIKLSELSKEQLLAYDYARGKIEI